MKKDIVVNFIYRNDYDLFGFTSDETDYDSIGMENPYNHQSQFFRMRVEKLDDKFSPKFGRYKIPLEDALRMGASSKSFKEKDFNMMKDWAARKHNGFFFIKY
jgi:hypothetical protein